MRAFIIVNLLALLCACGGGSGSGSGSESGGNSATIPIEHKFGGLWVGTITADGVVGSQDLIAMTTDDGRFQFLSIVSRSLFIGTVQVTTDTVMGVGLGYAGQGATLVHGVTATPVTIEATINQRVSLNGNWRADSGEMGSFELIYEMSYETDSSLALLADVWTTYDDNSIAVASLSIGDDGYFFGQNSNGCDSEGQLAIIDSTVNIYEMTITIANCLIAGDYAGLGILENNNYPNDTLFFIVSNNVRSVLIRFTR